MKHSASMLLAAGLAAAQSTTVSILMPMADSQKIAGSVISAGPTATQYFVECPSGTPSDECGLGPGLTVLYGPSTMAYTMAYTADFDNNEVYSVEANCKLDPSKDSASCAGTMVSAKATSYVSDVLTGYSTFILPVTITAGADKLAGGAGTTSADGTASPTASPTGTATTLSTTTATNSQGTGTSSATTAPASSSSTGGVPRITQNAVVLGAAALVGGAMLM